MADKDLPRYALSGIRRALALAILIVCALVTAAQAQIRTDGTLGRSPVSLTGPSFMITESLGRLAGSNLFYSFLVFNVGSGESATFITTTAGLANVISRVTGGSPSQINGPINLQSTNAAPNFFFINLAGVVFGQGAQIDVPAGFYVSTANYLKFPDGNFYADPKAVSTLSSAAPEAFGFLGTTRAAVTINNGADIGTPNSPFQIVAGDVTVDNAAIDNQAGDVRVIAIGGSAAEIGLTGTSPLAAGTLTLSNGGYLATTSAGAIPGGNITVAAGTISISGSNSGGVSGVFSIAPAGATAGAGNIDVSATQGLSLVNGGEIDSLTFGPGNAGPVTVSAGSLTIDSQGYTAFQTGIASEAVAGSGNSGSVHVTVVGQASIVNGGQISSDTYGPGNAGSMSVSAGSLTIDGQNLSFAEISSNADGGSSGNAGSVHVMVAGQASIANGGMISSTTSGPGNAGTVTVKAGTLVIDGSGSITGISSEALDGTGNAGDVNVAVDRNLSILNGGQINASTNTSGNAGTVTVKAGTLVTDAQCTPAGGCVATGISSDSRGTGNAGNVNVSVDGALSILGGAISSRTGLGNAGAITVKAGTLVMEGENSEASSIFSGIISFGYGSHTLNGGDISVTVDGTLTILGGGAQISAGTNGSGNGGNIAVKARTFIIEGLGISSADVGGTGNAGNLNVTVTGTLLMNPGLFETLSFGAGNAGAITVKAGRLVIDGGGIISDTGGGNAGSVNVTVDGAISIVNGGQISTSAGNGNGGSIVVSGAGTLLLQNGQITTSVTGLQGNGGDISIQAPVLVMETGFIQANTAAANASGGKVTINVDSLIPSGSTLFVGGTMPFAFVPDVFGFNVIQAAAPTGVSGTVQISTPVLDLIGSISALPAEFLTSGSFGRSPCAIVGGSSLSQVGRGGLPPKAGDLLWIDPGFELPATPPAVSLGSSLLVPPNRTVGSDTKPKTNPCWS